MTATAASGMSALAVARCGSGIAIAVPPATALDTVLLVLSVVSVVTVVVPVMSVLRLRRARCRATCGGRAAGGNTGALGLAPAAAAGSGSSAAGRGGGNGCIFTLPHIHEEVRLLQQHAPRKPRPLRLLCLRRLLRIRSACVRVSLH